MAGVELSTYYVTLAAETSQISSGIAKALNGADKIGLNAGKQIGKGIAKGVESTGPNLDSLAKDVEVSQQKISAATEKSAKAQAEANRKVEIAQAKLNEARDKYKAGSSQILLAEDRLVASQQKLVAATQASESQMKKLYLELDNAEQAFGDAQEAAESAAKGTEQAFKGIGGRIKSALSGDFKGAFNGVEADASTAANDVEQEFTSAGADAGEGFSQGFAGQLKNLAGLAGIAGIGSSIVGTFMEGMEREKLGDKLAAQLNLTQDASKEIGAISGSLYANAYGESLGEVNDAVSATMSSIPHLMDAPAAEIEAMTAKVLDLATAFEVDVSEASTTAGIMMKNGLAKDGTEAMDLITRAMQSVPKSVQGEILPVMDEYSKHFSDLGLSGGAAMGLIVSASQDGAIGMDKMGDALKEFTILSQESSEDLTGAWTALGLNQQDIRRDLLAGGETADKAFGKVIAGLKNIKDPADQAQKAITLFGTPLEDLGVGQIPQFLDQMDPAKTALTDFAGAAVDMGNTLNDNKATGLEGLKRSLQTNVVDFFTNSIMPVIDWVASKANMWGPMALGIAAVATAVGIWAGAQSLLAIAVNATIWPITAAVVAIGLMIGAVILAYQNIGWFKDAVNIAWTGIKIAIAAVVSWFVTVAWPMVQTALSLLGQMFTWLYVNIVSPIWTLIRIAIAVVVGALMTLWQGIVWLFQNVLGPVFMWLYHSVIKPVWSWISNAINTSWVFIRDHVFNPIKNFLYDTLGPAFRWFKDKVVSPIWSWISTKLTSVWNWVRDNALNPLMDWVENKLPAAFQAGKDAMGKIWEGLKETFWGPIDWVVNIAIKGLTDNIDKILDEVGLDDKMINFGGITKPSTYTGKNRGSEYAQGGYTGDGHWLEPAGVVHRGEYVIPKAQTQQLMKTAPGFLESIHRFGSKALGYAKGGLVRPVNAPFGSGYRTPERPTHDGVDFPAPTGTPIYAARAGRIIRASWSPFGGGNQTEIAHPGGLVSWYAHQSKFEKQAGELVNAGDLIGRVGNTGMSFGSHLHFSVFNGGWPNDVNPYGFLSGAITKGNPAAGGSSSEPSILEKMMGFLNVDKFLTGMPKSGGIVGDMVKGTGTKLIDSLKGWAGGLMPGIGSAAGSAAIKPMLHDNGGWLQPGLSLVNNQTGVPEAILNPAESANYKTLFEGDAGTVARGNTIINVERDKGEDGYELGTKIDARLAWAARK